MEKKVIKQDTTTIVILKDLSCFPAIVVKGIAKCDPRDTFDAEVGEKVANAKAWIKYYKKLIGRTTSKLKGIASLEEDIVTAKNELNQTMDYASDKLAKIEFELEELIKD